MMNKRGLSEVISAVLLVLVAVAAVVALWMMIVPYLQEKMRSGTECINYEKGYFEFEEQITGKTFNCYDYDNDLVGVSLSVRETQKSISDKVEGFYVSFAQEGNTVGIYSIKKDTFTETDTSDDVAHWMFSDKVPGRQDFIPKAGEAVTYVLAATSIQPDKDVVIDVYPMIEGRTCGMSDTVTVKPCMAGVDLNEA